MTPLIGLPEGERYPLNESPFREAAMKVDPNQTVGHIAASHAEALPLFDRLHIDYYAHGNRPLKDACYVCGSSLQEVVAELEKLAPSPGAEGRDWSQEPVAVLVEHIVSRHHAFTRGQLERIESLLWKEGEGPEPPHFDSLRRIFRQLKGDLLEHMAQEEEVYFPLLVEEERARQKDPGQPGPSRHRPLGHGLRLLLSDHGMLDREWKLVEDFSEGLASPEAGPRCNALHRALRDLAQDNHRHMHLEMNVLFPRAVDWGLLEASEAPTGG